MRYKRVNEQETASSDTDEDGMEGQQFLASRKPPHELKEHLDKTCKIIRGKFL